MRKSVLSAAIPPPVLLAIAATSPDYTKPFFHSDAACPIRLSNTAVSQLRHLPLRQLRTAAQLFTMFLSM
jgi:hypothetical protein